MNQPVPPSDFRNDAPAYADDAYGWAMHQAALIRGGERDALDWANIAEEIESMGQSEYRALESALRVTLLHILKWQHQPSHRARSWQSSIREHRRRFDRLLARNPGLKGDLQAILADAYADAREEASRETGLDIAAFPADPPAWDDIRRDPEL